MTFVVDNVARCLGEALRARIAPGARLSIVSAYFTIYAWSDLRRELEEAGGVRFLYGDPRGVAAPDPAEAEGRAFLLAGDGEVELARTLEQRPLARACAEWIRTKAEVRPVRQANFLHGKMFHFAPARGAASAAFAGSSNFTRRGLGFGAAPNIELNVEIGREDDRAALLAWFDGLWSDDARTRVLMLSATPVNTSLRDLRNQIYLMTAKRGDAFRGALGIGDLQTVFGVAQRGFLAWENARRESACEKSLRLRWISCGGRALSVTQSNLELTHWGDIVCGAVLCRNILRL